VDVVCLQETKMEDISHIMVLQMLGPTFGSYKFLPSVGASGGIFVVWHDRLASSGNFRIDAHSVSIQFNPGEGLPWWLTCVYAPPPQGSVTKIHFLHEPKGIRQNCHGPWLNWKGFQYDLQ
jgi:hypothetical protein